jgi:hypothetical protein
MPSLDVTEAFDVSFWDQIVVIRRVATVGAKGRVTTKDTPMSALAVVTAASPVDLQRVPEWGMMNKTISLYTPFRLQGPATDEAGNVTHPDEILWCNSLYIVNFLEDYSRYGRGFVHAVATSKHNVDYAPTPLPIPIPTPIGTA